MKRKWIYRLSGIVTLLALTCGTPANAQNSTEEGRNLLRNWISSQREAVRGIANVDVDEQLILSVDVGFGQQRLEMDAQRTVGNGNNPAGRAIRRVMLNGREVAPERGEQFRRRQHGLLRPEIGRVVDGFRFPVQDLARMRVNGQIRREDRNGRPMWRVDTIPQTFPDPVERLIAWFDVQPFQLRSTQAVLRGPGPTEIQIETSYERFEGIDLPNQIHVEGRSRAQRRLRSFTSQFKSETNYSRYRITRAGQ